VPATYVTEAELRANLGIENLYSSDIVETCCQTAQDLLNQFLWFDSAPVVGVTLQNNVATAMIANPAIFSTGQSVTLSGCGSTFNGTYTITGTLPWTNGTSTQLPSIAWNTTRGTGHKVTVLYSLQRSPLTLIFSAYSLMAQP
jgi:hypothetical protein